VERNMSKELEPKMKLVLEELEHVKKCDLTYVTELMRIQKLETDEKLDKGYETDEIESLRRQLHITQQIVASKIIPIKQRTIILDNVERAFALLPNYLKAQVCRELANTLVDTISLRTKDIVNMPEFASELQNNITAEARQQIETMDMECKARFESTKILVEEAKQELKDIRSKIELSKQEL